MTGLDPRLGENEHYKEFAKNNHRSPRTILRWMDEPNGLPYFVLGNRRFVNIPVARDWLLSRIRRPNRRKAA